MAEREERLKENWQERTNEAVKKAREAIHHLAAMDEDITFQNVHKHSGISRSFLYKNTEIRKEIEIGREQSEQAKIQRRLHQEKTKKSRDVVMEAKDRRIRKLEEENRRLKKEISALRGQIYSNS